MKQKIKRMKEREICIELKRDRRIERKGVEEREREGKGKGGERGGVKFSKIKTKCQFTENLLMKDGQKSVRERERERERER